MWRAAVVFVVLAVVGCGEAPAGAPASPTTATAATTAAAPSTTSAPDPPAAPATTTTVPPTSSTAGPAATTTTTVPSTDAPAGPEPRNPEPEPELRAVTPESPLRVWVIGDSLAGPLGEGLRVIVPEPVRITIDHVGGTGLARPDLFDWPDVIAERLPEVAPDAVVFHVGANDAQGMPIPGGWAEFGTPEWIEHYRSVVGSVMDQITDRTERLYWVGAPIMSGANTSAAMVVINRAFESEATLRERVVYVDAFAVFQDGAGEYAEELPGPDGVLVAVRQPDGVHYTGAGAVHLARHVWGTIAPEWGLEA